MLKMKGADHFLSDESRCPSDQYFHVFSVRPIPFHTRATGRLHRNQRPAKRHSHKSLCAANTFQKNSPVQRLGKNAGGYFGETIDIRAVLAEAETAAARLAWKREIFHENSGFKWSALRRPSRNAAGTLRFYISAGIHGDEPAGPLAVLRLLLEDKWPADADITLIPCLNPIGFTLNRRENGSGIDLNRDYLHLRSDEIRAHIAWLEKQSRFDLCLCLHEDWESHGFYVYEINLDNKPSPAEAIIREVSKVCPVDMSDVIEGRPAKNGIIHPSADPLSRPQWPEAFWLLTHKTRLSCTLEAPSDFPVQTRVDSLVAGVNAALASQVLQQSASSQGR